MDGISAIGGVGKSYIPTYPVQPASTQAGALNINDGSVVGALFTSESAITTSASMVSATSESLAISDQPLLADEQALGLAILLLTLAYLQSDDEKEKEGLLALMLILSEQQNQGNRSQALFYSSSSLSIDMTQVAGVSSDIATNAYSSGQAAGNAEPIQGGNIDAIA